MHLIGGLILTDAPTYDLGSARPMSDCIFICMRVSGVSWSIVCGLQNPALASSGRQATSYFFLGGPARAQAPQFRIVLN
jgi:hypothetical protein